jgi:hypothetical protein
MECNECALYQKDIVIHRNMLYTETIKYYIYIPFTLVHILGKPVCKRSEANYTSLPEIMHRYSSGTTHVNISLSLQGIKDYI